MKHLNETVLTIRKENVERLIRNTASELVEKLDAIKQLVNRHCHDGMDFLLAENEQRILSQANEDLAYIRGLRAALTMTFHRPFEELLGDFNLPIRGRKDIYLPVNMSDLIPLDRRNIAGVRPKPFTNSQRNWQYLTSLIHTGKYEGSMEPLDIDDFYKHFNGDDQWCDFFLVRGTDLIVMPGTLLYPTALKLRPARPNAHPRGTEAYNETESIL